MVAMEAAAAMAEEGGSRQWAPAAAERVAPVVAMVAVLVAVVNSHPVARAAEAAVEVAGLKEGRQAERVDAAAKVVCQAVAASSRRAARAAMVAVAAAVVPLARVVVRAVKVAVGCIRLAARAVAAARAAAAEGSAPAKRAGVAVARGPAR